VRVLGKDQPHQKNRATLNHWYQPHSDQSVSHLNEVLICRQKTNQNGSVTSIFVSTRELEKVDNGDGTSDAVVLSYCDASCEAARRAPGDQGPNCYAASAVL